MATFTRWVKILVLFYFNSLLSQSYGRDYGEIFFTGQYFLSDSQSPIPIPSPGFIDRTVSIKELGSSGGC